MSNSTPPGSPSVGIKETDASSPSVSRSSKAAPRRTAPPARKSELVKLRDFKAGPMGPTGKISQMASSYSHLNEIGREVGIEVWKMVDEDTLEKQIKTTHGYFSVDKSYILLWTTYGSDNLNTYSYHIHSWIGEVAQQNNSLVRALAEKIAELEHILEGKQIVTHSEVQGHESPEFMSYFKKGLHYVPPVKLARVDFDAIQADREQPKLYHIQGRRNVRVKQVEPSTKSLNKGDVFILDLWNTIYQWNGSGASRMQKGKALDLTVRLRDERGAQSKVIILEESGNDDPEFWKILGGKGDIKEADPSADDWEKEETIFGILYQVSDSENNDFDVTKKSEGKEQLNTSMLNGSDSFVVDLKTEIYIWIGKNSSQEKRNKASEKAQELKAETNRPTWTRLTKVTQGSETTLFKDRFKGDWGEYIETYEYKKRDKVADKQEQEKVNVDELHHPEKYAIAKEEFREIIPHAGEDPGSVKIWYVKEHLKHELPSEEYGVFYEGESYIIQYEIQLNDGGRRYVVYFWQGRSSSLDDKGTCALLAKELGHSLGKRCVQARVVHSKEPDHFLSHFKGKMVTRKGRRTDLVDLSTYESLFQIRGTSEVTTRAVEVEKATKSLSTTDTFVLVRPQGPIIWKGSGSNQHEHFMAEKLAAKFSQKPPTSLLEGQETEEFWLALGGKGRYQNLPLLHQGKPPTRLFQCSSSTGIFKVFEIQNFSQDDLDCEDVMILDAYYEVYVWVGSRASAIEKRMSLETALEYVKTAPGERQDVPIYLVQSGFEPPSFTSYFFGWDSTKAREKDPYLKKLWVSMKKIGPNFRDNSGLLDILSDTGYKQRSPEASSSATPAAEEAAPKKKPTLRSSKKTSVRHLVNKDTLNVKEELEAPLRASPNYDYSRLKKKPYPDGVDPENLERWLNDIDFYSIFKTSRCEFDKLPKWKKINIKKSIGLF